MHGPSLGAMRGPDHTGNIPGGMGGRDIFLFSLFIRGDKIIQSCPVIFYPKGFDGLSNTCQRYEPLAGN